MKAAIYDTPYENTVKPTELAGFTLVEKRAVTSEFFLNSSEAIRDLVMMTPYFYRTGKLGHERLAALDSLSVTASFYLLIYRKTRQR